MSKVLFIAIAGHGHVNPTIGIVRELIDRGENVTYIAGEEFREKIEATGAKFKGHKNFNMSDRVTKNLNVPNNKSLLDIIGNINLTDSKILSNLTNTFKEIIEAVFNSNEKFDYIIYDSPFILGPEIGRVLKIPTISSTSTFGINEAIIKNILASLNLDKFKEILNNPDYINFTKDLQEKYDIKFPSMLSEFTGKGMINIVYTSKYFQPYSETFDESYKFIGPSVIDRKESIDINLKNKENKKIIYISLGTIFNNSIEFYESCFEAFKDIDAEVIMSVGKKIDINIFENIPSNFSVHNYVPQLEVLKHADVFITHGGMNSTNEGLYYDVPLILIPQSVDQPLVANRVAELGAGIVIEKSETTPEMLKECVERIFSDNSFKINSKKIGKSLREAGGYKRGVDEILNLKNSIQS
ncbi:macrolide family glycosyltransferase [Clostridium sp.]|uniref:macrolide family glycosyltransferase n=1 Tax=Clostridium sp. TaxID=1506 RepID=UPI0028416800|nr:macrolide family glycosyltransferase [Clostridium sp.]MDR3594686.1 glycosyltransferase [Clostridium sp.]